MMPFVKIPEMEGDLGTWSAQLLFTNDKNPPQLMSYTVTVQYVPHGLTLLIPVASAGVDKILLTTRLRFSQAGDQWKRDLLWSGITIGQMEESTLLTLFDHLYRPLATLRFRNFEDTTHFRQRINQDKLTLLPWNEYEIAQRVGGAQWHHYRRTFQEAGHPWPVFVVNMAYLMPNAAYDNEAEEDPSRKERMFIELVVRVRQMYKLLNAARKRVQLQQEVAKTTNSKNFT